MSPIARVAGLSLVLRLLACGSEEEASCPSGVKLDGKCLTSRDGGVPDADEPDAPTVGALCATNEELTCGRGARTVDAVLLCRAGHWDEVTDCASAPPCVPLPGGRSVHCGLGDSAQPVAVAGAACATAGAASCDPARRLLLGCIDGRWATVESCSATTACGRTAGATKGPGWTCPGPAPCAVCK